MITIKQDLVITKIVAGLFAMYICPVNRGRLFKWEEFPAMAVEWVLVNFFLYFKKGYKFDKDEVKEHAEWYAKHLVERADLL